MLSEVPGRAATRAKLHLADLAGSERQAEAGTSGLRFDEAKQINASLLVLSRVIRALTVPGGAEFVTESAPARSYCL